MVRVILCIVFCICVSLYRGQSFHFDSIFQSSSLLKKITRHPDAYRLQIIYTEIDRSSGAPVFTDHVFNIRPESYFYCASLVKLPVAILSLRKLNELGLSQEAILFTDSSEVCHRRVRRDTSAPGGYPSVAHYIRKMLVVSDNAAYSRLYEFLGVDYMHERLARGGYPEIRILNRYDGSCRGKGQRITNPVTFLDGNLKVIYEQKALTASGTYPMPLKDMRVGKAYYEGTRKVHAPKDFRGSNYMSLGDCHRLLRELIFPAEGDTALKVSQRDFLIRALSDLPRQNPAPRYSASMYPDNYKKYLFYGDRRTAVSDTGLVITNIVGRSYGFLSDCAYFSDQVRGLEFMLSAVIYANEDEVINDGKYDYQTLGLPFLAELGRQVYGYELRKKLRLKSRN